MTNNLKSELLDQLVRYSYQYRPEQPFLLASGETSAEYLDCRLALSQPRAMADLGRVILSMLDLQVVAIGGLTMGADPLALSTCMASADVYGRDVRWFSVRKEPKEHGQQKWIEGLVKTGERVAIVDDVVTKGTSTIKAIECCREYGLRIAQVIVLVDRQEQNGLDNIRAQAGSARVEAIFSKREIREHWEAVTRTQ